MIVLRGTRLIDSASSGSWKAFRVRSRLTAAWGLRLWLWGIEANPHLGLRREMYTLIGVYGSNLLE